MKRLSIVTLVVLALTAGAALGAGSALRPYVLTENAEGDVALKVESCREGLEKEGFEIVGEFSPYADTHILVVTNERLKEVASGSAYGGFGAAQRVAITKVDDKVQISYTNPTYMANVYRLEDDLHEVSEAMAFALGREQDFGSKKGLQVKKLRKYHYMAFMPYFDDTVLLAKHLNHDEAIEKVEAGLAAGEGGVSKVYRIDIPGKEEVLFGVALSQGEGADETIMNVVDTAELSHAAHLPYEILVSGKEVIALHGKFRIAQSFPDLTMGTFMKISGAPDGIAKSLEKAVE